MEHSYHFKELKKQMRDAGLDLSIQGYWHHLWGLECAFRGSQRVVRELEDRATAASILLGQEEEIPAYIIIEVLQRR